MPEQLEKLQVDTEELEKQTNKQTKKDEMGPSTCFWKVYRIGCAEALEKRLKGKNKRAQEAVTESRSFQQDE